jgi:hypothetical protein
VTGLRLTIAVWVLCVAGVGGCADVGGDDDGFGVRLANDTSRTVVLGWCTGQIRCGSFADTWTLKPGQSASTRQDPDGVFRPMEVLSTTKVVTGCLPLQFSRAVPKGTLIGVSRMVTCGTSLGAAASQGHDWPFAQY